MEGGRFSHWEHMREGVLQDTLARATQQARRHEQHKAAWRKKKTEAFCAAWWKTKTEAQQAARREEQEKQFKAVSTMLIKQMETLARREATVETMKASTLAELQKETPEGWTCHFSNTTGQIYFWHVEREFSQFELPTEV